MSKEVNPLFTMVTSGLMGCVLILTTNLFWGSIFLFASGTMAIKYRRQHSKLTPIFRKFEIELDDIVPELLYREKNENDDSTIYYYSIPPGFTLADFKKTEDAIKTFLDKQVYISEGTLGSARCIIIECT